MKKLLEAGVKIICMKETCLQLQNQNYIRSLEIAIELFNVVKADRKIRMIEAS